MIVRCQAGFELLLEREIRQMGLSMSESGLGWLRIDSAEENRGLATACFAHSILTKTVEITGESVNGIAGAISDYFLDSARTERFEKPWTLRVEATGGADGLGRRAEAVRAVLAENLKKRMSRVAKLATADVPRGPVAVRGLFVVFVDYKRAFVSRDCRFGGQRRMADDSQAPSRSYLKIEEAFGVLGREPAQGETVADLGAAPGGWSYSGAKRGARVVAVDNGPLKGGALDHPLIEHLREDAFGFRPVEGTTFDWMFCDLVEDPHHVLQNLAKPWLANRWCRGFVVNLKFGRTDPIALLNEVHASDSIFSLHARDVKVRHLYHDREEFTIVGNIAVKN